MVCVVVSQDINSYTLLPSSSLAHPVSLSISFSSSICVVISIVLCLFLSLNLSCKQFHSIRPYIAAIPPSVAVLVHRVLSFLIVVSFITCSCSNVVLFVVLSYLLCCVTVSYHTSSYNALLSSLLARPVLHYHFFIFFLSSVCVVISFVFVPFFSLSLSCKHFYSVPSCITAIPSSVILLAHPILILLITTCLCSNFVLFVVLWCCCITANQYISSHVHCYPLCWLFLSFFFPLLNFFCHCPLVK